MSLDRKGRPISVLNAEERKALLEQLLGVWNDNPKWGLGQLISKVASIRSGTRTAVVDRVTDADMLAGLSALSPMDWEIDDLGASPVDPVEMIDTRALTDPEFDV